MRGRGMEPKRWMRASVLTGAVLALLMPVPVRIDLKAFAAASTEQVGNAPLPSPAAPLRVRPEASSTRSGAKTSAVEVRKPTPVAPQVHELP